MTHISTYFDLLMALACQYDQLQICHHKFTKQSRYQLSSPLQTGEFKRKKASDYGLHLYIILVILIIYLTNISYEGLFFAELINDI